MRVLVLGAMKGGAGKSFLCQALAVAALRSGERVAGLDADFDQQSFANWAADRADPNLRVRAVSPGDVPMMLTRAERNDFTLAIVDTPGRLDAHVMAVMRRSDLLLVPCPPRKAEMQATVRIVPTLQLIERRFAFVISAAQPLSPARTEEARQGLAEFGTVAPVAVHYRTPHQDALNVGQAGPEVSGIAGEEIQALWDWVRPNLN